MITLTDVPFDPGAALNAFSDGRLASGAVVSFLGLARGEANQPTALELEAYGGFTEREIGR
ncbi:MAG TPA: molybdenum cofactor biosynthesis protein MoaE, partial [Caulobacteraceae bacterium]